MKVIARIVGVVLLVALVVATGLFLVVTRMPGAARDAVTVTIPAGANVRQIAALLAAEHVIAKPWALRLYMRFAQPGAVLKAGTYTLPPRLTVPAVVALLAEGKSAPRDISVTFPEGWRAQQMAQRLRAKGFDADGFLQLVAHPDAALRERFSVLASLPAGQSLEGYLFPDTYKFLPTATPRDIVTALLENFSRKVTPQMRAHVAAGPYTLHQVVTMASIVEREVHRDEERPIVSGIFYNRLQRGIPLGSDATLDFILGTSKVKHTLADTKVDSPYNTYLHAGLPPGPIGNPGLSALRAAAYPAETDYLYFLNNAATGKTVFARTLDEHVRNKRNNGL